MSTADWKVDVSGEQVSVVYDPGTSETAVFMCAHGAGGNMNDRSVVATARALRDVGIGVVRFNFLYRERKSARPDPMAKLTPVIEAVAGRVRAELDPNRLIIGGRSMGGRAASVLAAAGFDADGLLLLAYPLHPPGKPEQLRDEHLPRIRMPVLCFNGTRDPFCTRELMDRVLSTVTTRWDMRWVDNADHSFHVPKSSGRTDAEILQEIARVSSEWVRRTGA